MSAPLFRRRRRARTVDGMGYLPRFDAPGAVHHVWTRGVGPAAIYADVEDKLAFLAISASSFARTGVTCLAYCLMTTHYHFVLRTPEAGLSHAMQRINGLYARSFNRRHERWGHLYGERFGSTFVQTQEHLLVCLRYVFLNPLDEPTCRHPAEWPWSSYANAIAGRPDPLAATDDLLRLVGGAAALARFVEQQPFTSSEDEGFTSSEEASAA
jgi:REP element-mobilizing transposase RayT